MQLQLRQKYLTLFPSISPAILLGEPKNGAHKMITLQNRNICEQGAENLSLSLSIILSLRN